MTANNLTHLNKRAVFVGNFEDIFDAFAAIRAERERQNRELLKDRDWLDDKVEYPDSLYQPRRKQFVDSLPPADQTALMLGEYDLGTRFVVSGGEVLEIGPQENDSEIPF